MEYDPLKAPEGEDWLSMDDDEKMAIIENYHRSTEEDFEGMKVHCVIHEIVENQIAMGEELPVRDKLAQLIDGGLDRHEAIHAIGMVLSGYLFDLMESDESAGEHNQEYFDELKDMTAEKYREGYEE
jgi:hypothetical protein